MKTPVTLIAAFLAAAVFVAGPAFSQADMETVPTTGFAATTRKPAVFPHDRHNEKAQIADCGVCHHGEKDGRQDPKNTSEGTPCSDCHAEKAKPGRTPLMRAFHRQCMGCHLDVNKGPVTCGQCHVK